MGFTNIPNTTRETRGIIYDILATYNIILLNQKRWPMLAEIKREYKTLKIPDIDDHIFKYNLSYLLKNEWNVSLEEVIDECKNDDIFPAIVDYLC